MKQFASMTCPCAEPQHTHASATPPAGANSTATARKKEVVKAEWDAAIEENVRIKARGEERAFRAAARAAAAEPKEKTKKRVEWGASRWSWQTASDGWRRQWQGLSQALRPGAMRGSLSLVSIQNSPLRGQAGQRSG
jgi:hypothetical protein